jgi:hypothetical protein
VTIDERHLNRRAFERTRGVESTETTAEDHHVWYHAHVLDNT